MPTARFDAWRGNFAHALNAVSSQPKMLEHEGELEAILAAAERAARGEGAVVFVEAPAGMGKSRLLEAGCHEADQRGFQLLRARGGELEQDFAYGVVRQLLERRLMTASTSEREALLKGAAELAGPAIGLGSEALQGGAPDPSFGVAHGLYWLVSNPRRAGAAAAERRRRPLGRRPHAALPALSVRGHMRGRRYR
jgi:hypothetical protein